MKEGSSSQLHFLFERCGAFQAQGWNWNMIIVYLYREAGYPVKWATGHSHLLSASTLQRCMKSHVCKHTQTHTINAVLIKHGIIQILTLPEKRIKLMTIHYQDSPLFPVADSQHMAYSSTVCLEYSNLCLVAFQYAWGARYQDIGGYQLIQTASYSTKWTTYKANYNILFLAAVCRN